MDEFKTIDTTYGLTVMAQAEEMGTLDQIDALITLAGHAAMLGWLLYAAPLLTSTRVGVL